MEVERWLKAIKEFDVFKGMAKDVKDSIIRLMDLKC